MLRWRYADRGGACKVDLSEADFYWASFHSATLEGAIMVRRDLRGARLDRATCAAPICATPNYGLDNLGGTTEFIAADLTARTCGRAGRRRRPDRRDLNERTVLPRGFRPDKAGMVLKREGK